ncbi:uncharacterized protein LOC126682983 [Mercurialis annua]|uniref:uncharacterized protein LOC126682983 n=1 Tax=Mercurialis annua TaxID=3986 RepID=UPI00215E9C5D|nr:uncharacterized protein LOC126682983 [Mercurialis annua]
MPNFMPIQLETKMIRIHYIVLFIIKFALCLWRGIHTACVKNIEVWDKFKGGISVRLGNRDNINLWNDIWVGDQTLSSLYPRLYQIAMDKNASVRHNFNSAHFSYCLNWNRSLQVGDQELLDSLQVQLRDHSHRPEVIDAVCWERTDGFTPAVKGAAVYSFSQLCKLKLPPQINFFFWLLARGRISSKISSAHRGIITRENTGCSLCMVDETNLHIFMHCHYAWKVWSKFFSMCNISSTLPNSLIEFFMFRDSLSDWKHRVLWRTIWFYCIWDLWKARNRRGFNDEFLEANSVVFMSICKTLLPITTL